MDIDKIALDVAHEVWPDVGSQGDISEFARRLLARVQQESEPVAFVDDWRDNIFGQLTDDFIPSGTNLYLHPPAPQATIPKWRSIESAPTTGRKMILLLGPSKFPQVAFSNTWWTSGFSVENKPTHWMPLPAAPTPEEGDG